MIFNSLEFLLFVALIFPVYFVLRTWQARTTWLLLASWMFYASWSPRFLLLLIATTWVDFVFAQYIDRAVRAGGEADVRRARRLVATSVSMNLGVLALFKYSRFLYEQVALLVALPPPPTWLAAEVPLGISFYTFHSISYIVDTYRRLRPPTLIFREFALYVAFFPQLIAGPITRWSAFGPQIQSPRTVSGDDWTRGAFRIVKGLVKKVVLADALGTVVDRVYADVAWAAPLEILFALYAYTFQIYFDFSGYTDIALGLALLLGFRLPENFRHPYRSLSPREFWQRWHITLSTWLRDYLYVSLGGNRQGSLRTYVNLLITMLLGGLWHGAAWHFVLWGGFHGAWLALHRALTGRQATPRSPAWVRGLVTFHLVVATWVLFRAPSLDVVAAIARGLWVAQPISGPFPIGPALALLAGVVSHLLGDRLDLERWWMQAPRLAQGAVIGVVIAAVGVFSAQSQRFIYFQF